MNKRLRILIPSIGSIIFSTILLILILSGKPQRLLGDTDTGFHIKTGEIILETRAVPKHDVYSFHSPALPWTAHAWLSEVIMALLHRALGLTGVAIFFALVIASTYYILFRTLRAYNRDILLSSAFVFLVMASSILHWLARPHIFSLLLTVLFSHLLEEYQYHNRNRLYVLPVLMFLWVNLHGGFILGFVLIGLYLAGNLFRVLFGLRNAPEIKGKVLPLAFVFLGSLLASLLNPYGYHILTFPFTLVSDSFLMDHIAEYLSPNFHRTMPFRYVIFLTIVVVAISRSPFDPIELMLIIFFTHMGLYSVRYIPLSAIVLCPILVRHAESLLANIQGSGVAFFRQRSENIARIDSSSNGCFWTTAIIGALCVASASGKLHFQFDEETPFAAVEFLKQETLNGNMFNNDMYGDYLIYAAWPQYKVFIDGRFDMYGSSLIKDYVEVGRLSPEWQQVLDKYHINWVFDAVNSPLSLLLLERQDWRLIYADKVSYIFLKDAPENQAVLQKFRQAKPLTLNGNVDIQ